MIDVDLVVFDIDGTLVHPKGRRVIRKAREKGDKEGMKAAYTKHAHAPVLRVLDEVPSSVDVLVVTSRSSSREEETLAFLNDHFFPRVGAHTRRIFVSFRGDKNKPCPKEKVRRLLALTAVCRSIRGKVSMVKSVLIYEDDEEVIAELLRARRKHRHMPKRFVVKQPQYDKEGKSLPLITHEI